MADERKHCSEHAGWRSDCNECMRANYLFDGEPEHPPPMGRARKEGVMGNVCGNPGHGFYGRSDCPTCAEPPIFDGEPEHCSLCGEPGHTHDEHWLFQHEPVKALQERERDLTAQIKTFRELLDEIDADGRKAFIREAAMRLFASYEHTAEPTLPSLYYECWEDARGLWGAKPEDC